MKSEEPVGKTKCSGSIIAQHNLRDDNRDYTVRCLTNSRKPIHREKNLGTKICFQKGELVKERKSEGTMN
jgi:hypothetical protein